jgi:type IV pilus assembly protein PilQ
MKNLLFCVVLVFTLVHCTTSNEPDELADLEVPEEDVVADSPESELIEPESAEGIDPDDISPSGDLLAENNPPPSRQESDQSGSSSFSNGPEVKVVGLDFKAKENGGTIIIRTSGPANYTTRNNEGNQQFIVEVANAQLPERFKRPYNTKEFEGPIAGIQAYQKTAGGTARFVIQLKESIDPFVQQDGNILRISATGAFAGDSSQGQGGFSVTSSGDKIDGRILTNKNLDDFLLGNSKYYGRKISLSVKDADIRDVFSFIAEESGLNIILADEVTGKISLKLRKIPWDQTLVVIMKSRQLGYVRQGNILRIAKLSDLQREADSARTVLESQNKLKPIRVRVFPVSYAKVGELEVQARDFLSERGKVKGDQRTNSLIVNDVDENIERIAKLITILDTQTPQVLIEAKVVEARQSFSKRVGVNWNFSGDPVDLGPNGKGVPINLQMGANVAPGGGAGTSAGDFSLSLGTLDFVGDLTATLSLFEFDNLIKVVSSPRIMTLNGQKATIEQKTDIPVPSTTAAVAGGVATTTFSFKPVSLLLEVQPQITADGGIIMVVKVKREFLGAQFSNGGTPINSREANTTVLINNGQTVVMGGIFQSDATEQETGVPFLRKVPIIGTLFKEAVQTKEKIELIIFLTPRIMNKDRAFRQAKGSSS